MNRTQASVLGAASLALFLLALGWVDVFPVKLVYNGSASAPIGFYRVSYSPLSKGDYVLVRLPLDASLIARRYGYLPSDIPALKRIAGLSGDKVCRIGSRIFIDDTLLATALVQDPAGRSLPVWQGCRRLAPEELFLLNRHPLSFDSRYFGPVTRDRVIGRARPFP